jgi:glycosyltransferase involved in cell wall biosynthesis
MRIAFVSTILHYPWGGADALWTSAAEMAAERGDALFLGISELTAPHERIAALAARGAALSLRSYPQSAASLWQRAWRKAPWAAASPRRLGDDLRNFRPDLVVVSCGGTYDALMEPALFAWLRSSGIRYRLIANFQTENPALPEPDRQWIREVFLAAEQVFFVSSRNLETTRRHLCAPLPNGTCVHNPLATATELPWPNPEPWALASVGRLEAVKGVDLLLQALGAALGAVPDWRLNIYGRGPQRDYLADCAAYHGIADRVHFAGFVSRLDEIWEQNHLLVSAALDEGVPMTIPEAMLRGRAVLATRVGGAAEWIDPGQTGFICPAASGELLADSLREAWGERRRWRELGAAAAGRTRSRYRPDDFRRILA